MDQCDFAINSNHDTPPVEGLPLQVIEHGDKWWYACSVPIYSERLKYLKFWHRRFDVQHAPKYMVEKKGAVDVKTAPFRNVRSATNNHLCDKIQWHVIGDRDEVERLVSKCRYVGGKRSMGFGRVRKWIVTESGHQDKALFLRPLPIEYAEQHGIEGMVSNHGYRPAARSKQNQTLCVLPI